MMTRTKPSLVIGGLTLANPFVGQGVYTLRLIRALERWAQLDFVVLVSKTPGEPSTIPSDRVVTLPRHLRSHAPIADSLLDADQLVRYVERNFPDSVFHAPGPLVSLRRCPRTVITMHDCIYRHFTNYDGRFGIRRRLAEAAERYARKAAAVITVSEFSKRDLAAQTGIPNEKIHVVYNWIDNEFFETPPPDVVREVRNRLQLPARFWLYIGGYDYRKNVDQLLTAYGIASSRRTLPPLVLAGQLPTRRHVSQCDVGSTLAKLGPARSRVLLLGSISSSDLPILYRSATLVVYPSLLEGFGLPVAEAMSVGTSVLCSNTGALPEIVSNPVCLFDPRDLNRLVDKLIAAADDEKQFKAALAPEFTEAVGLPRYLEVIRRVAQ